MVNYSMSLLYCITVTTFSYRYIRIYEYVVHITGTRIRLNDRHFKEKFSRSIEGNIFLSQDKKVAAVSYTHLTLPTTPYV